MTSGWTVAPRMFSAWRNARSSGSSSSSILFAVQGRILWDHAAPLLGGGCRGSGHVPGPRDSSTTATPSGRGSSLRRRRSISARYNVQQFGDGQPCLPVWCPHRQHELVVGTLPECSRGSNDVCLGTRSRQEDFGHVCACAAGVVCDR